MATSVALSPVAILQFFDNTGKPCIGGSLLTQSGGVNYPTYSDPLGATPLPNPVPLNSRGEISTAVGSSSELFLQTGVAYTFTLKDAAGNQLWSVGNITTISTGAVSFPTASGSANAQIVTNPVSISLGIGTIQWFLPVAANTGATTVNDDNTGSKNVLYLTKALTGGELEIGVPAQIIYDGTNWNLVQSAKGPVSDYYVDSSVSVNTITVAVVNQAQAANTNGARIRVKIANTNTSSPVIIWGGSGPFSIVLEDRTTTPPAGSLIAGNAADFIFDTALGSAILQNPSRVTISFTGTATGIAGSPTGTIQGAIAPDGRLTQVMIPPATFTGTSNAVTGTITGFPASLTPASTQGGACYVTDSGTASPGAWSMAGTTMSFGKGNNYSLGGFTASGTKTLIAGSGSTYISLSYPLSP